jgi:hypothetical protein
MIAEQSGLPTEHNAAVKKFFDYLRNHYDDYPRLEKRVIELRSELIRIQGFVSIPPKLNNSMASLVRRGISNDDIMIISKFLEDYNKPGSLFSSKGTESDERNTKASETKEQETNESILEGTKAKIRW